MSNPSSTSTKVQKRVPMACTVCRQRKIKCKPREDKCEQCYLNNKECKYEPVNPVSPPSADSSFQPAYPVPHAGTAGEWPVIDLMPMVPEQAHGHSFVHPSAYPQGQSQLNQYPPAHLAPPQQMYPSSAVRNAYHGSSVQGPYATHPAHNAPMYSAYPGSSTQGPYPPTLPDHMRDPAGSSTQSPLGQWTGQPAQASSAASGYYRSSNPIYLHTSSSQGGGLGTGHPSMTHGFYPPPPTPQERNYKDQSDGASDE